MSPAGRTSLAQATLDALESMGISPTAGPGEDVWSFEAGGGAGTWTCFVWVREPEAQLVVHSVAPFAVPEAQRVAVALYLTRANFGLVVGNFELDLDDGEVRFKTSVDLEGTEVGQALFRHLIGANLRATDTYLGGVVEVMEGADPATVANAAEPSDS